MGSGLSRSKATRACPPPPPKPATAQANVVSGGCTPGGGAPAAPGSAHTRQATAHGAAARPKTVLRPTTQACSQRPDTEYSQATTRPNTVCRPPTQSGSPEVQVLAFNFGVERNTPPVSDRSAQGEKMPLETVVHFPPPPDGGAITEEDGRSSTTYDSASVYDAGSVPQSRGRTPGGLSRTSASHSRPGTRGLETAMGVTQEGDEFQVFPDEDGDPELQANDSVEGSPRSDYAQQEPDVSNDFDGDAFPPEKPADSGMASNGNDGAGNDGAGEEGGGEEGAGEDAAAGGLGEGGNPRSPMAVESPHALSSSTKIGCDPSSPREQAQPKSHADSPDAVDDPSQSRAKSRRGGILLVDKRLQLVDKQSAVTEGLSKNLGIFVEDEELDELAALRKKKEEKIRKELEARAKLSLKLKELAPRVLRAAKPDDLIFEMHWGFPPRPRTTNDLRPPTPPPAGWEDVVVANRKFRLAIRVVLGSWIDRAVRSAFSRLHCAVTDKKYFREKEEEVRRRLYRWFRDILIPCTTEWRAIAAQTAVMRKKTRKVMMWMMNKDVIRALGAWIACWAHKKDWRVCALKNCLHTRIKKATKAEILMFAKAKRGSAILQEFATLTMVQLIEKVASSKVDIESIHHNLTLEEMMRLKVFKIDEKDKALNLVWKIDRLMREDTTRLDHMNIWDGKMLMNVDMYMDQMELMQDEKDKLAQHDDGVKKTRAMSIDLSPGGISKENQLMNVTSERMMDTWAWGYILEITQSSDHPPATLQAVKVKLLLQDFAIAMVHVVDVINHIEKWQSGLVSGKGNDPQWYEFEFTECDEEGNIQPVYVEWMDGYAVHISVSDRGIKDDSVDPCKVSCFLDHRPQRQLNPQMLVRSGSCNGTWHFTPAPRSIELQVVLRVDEGFGKEKDEIAEEKETPTSYQKGVELVQSANRRVEELLRRIRKGERIDEKELETSRIELRRLALGSCDEPLEERLTYIPSKKLLMEAAMHTTCAYHPKMREFWMLDWEIDLHFLICDLDGKAKREVQFTSADNLKVFAFCFDETGDMFIANNQQSFYRYVPADSEFCTTYLRMWKTVLVDFEHGSWHNASGVCSYEDTIFGIFMYGPIVQISKSAGSVMRVINLRFEVKNIEQMLFVMHRFVIVDAHTIKVCDLNGELVSVPLGPQGNMTGGTDEDANPNATKMGPFSDGQGGKNVCWRQTIENGMDRPRILWDGSFLWITETQLRKTDDNQLKMRHFMWHCYAPMTWNAHLPTQPNEMRAYGKRTYLDITPTWDQDGKLHSHLRDPNAHLTPGAHAGSTSLPPTPSQAAFAPQTSGLENESSLHDIKHDRTHFKRPNTQDGEKHGEAPGSQLTVSL